MSDCALCSCKQRGVRRDCRGPQLARRNFQLDSQRGSCILPKAIPFYAPMFSSLVANVQALMSKF